MTDILEVALLFGIIIYLHEGKEAFDTYYTLCVAFCVLCMLLLGGYFMLYELGFIGRIF